MSIHDGHRERLKKQFSEFGLEVFNDVNVLELLLFFSIPRRDTNEVAHRLLDKFRSLDGVFKASRHELMAVPGVGVNSALLITLVHQLIKKLEISKTAEITTIKKPKEAAEYLIPRFINEENEKLLMLCLDNKRAIISCEEIAKGTVNSVEINTRLIAQIAFQKNASTIMLAHNHPSGLPCPSIEDDMLTREIVKSLKLFQIKLVDHLIISDKRYYSMLENGMMTW